MFLKNIISVVIPICVGFFLSVGLNRFVWLHNSLWPYILLYFGLFCFVSNLVYAAKAGSTGFIGILLGGIVIKLLLAFIIVFIFSLLQKKDFFKFSAHFVLHYILFTIFEVKFLKQLINSTVLK